MQFQLNQSVAADGRRLIRTETISRLYEPRVSTQSQIDPDERYAMGWFVTRLDGQRLIWHSGNIDGYSSFVSFMPERKLAVMILTNQGIPGIFQLPDVVAGPLHLLPWRIYHTALDPQKPAQDGQSGGSPHLPSPQLALPSPPAEPAAFVGSFIHPAYGELQVAVGTKGTLEIEYYGLKGELVLQNADLDENDGLKGSDVFKADFRIAAWPMFSVQKFQFERTDGKISGLLANFEPDSGPIEFRRR